MTHLCLFVRVEPPFGTAVSSELVHSGLKTCAASSLPAAMRLLSQWRFDVVLVDGDGFDATADGVAEMVSGLLTRRVPIVMLSSCVGEDEQIRTLERGAVDIVLKPTSARLVALKLRRLVEHRGMADHGVFESLPWRSEPDVATKLRARLDELSIDLTTGQFEMLLLLAASNDRFMSRKALARVLGTTDHEGSRGVDMQVSRLRKKLRESGDGAIGIQTVYGGGYRLTLRHSEPMSHERQDLRTVATAFHKAPAFA